MNEIDRLKHEEQAWMDEDDLYSEEFVETLKIEESDTYERPSYVPQRSYGAQPTQQRERSRWLPFFGVIAVIWALSAGVVSAGSWWALFLLFPAYKNWQRVQEDRQHGTVDKQTRKSMRGAMFALLFAFMFLFGAWGAFFPMLVIAWIASSILVDRWEREPVYY